VAGGWTTDKGAQHGGSKLKTITSLVCLNQWFVSGGSVNCAGFHNLCVLTLKRGQNKRINTSLDKAT